MNRRKFVRSLAAGTVASAGVTRAATAVPGAPPPALPDARLTTTPLVLQAPRADGVEAVWGVRERCVGCVEWKAADGTGGVARADPHGFVAQFVHAVSFPPVR